MADTLDAALPFQGGGVAMIDLLKNLVDDIGLDPIGAHWVRVRRATRDCDHALTGTSQRWLRNLPPRRRPLRLCDAHPRVANRIAWCWNDPDLSAAVLSDLLVDRRGGRQGFASSVVRELQRLREFNAQHRVETGPGPEGLFAQRLVPPTGIEPVSGA